MIFSDELLSRARGRVAVLTGAGVSAESGVPTFRDPDGFWSKLKPEELASIDGFMKNPEMVWQWYQHRRRVLEEIQPNAGHFALVELAKKASSFSLVTQNVDELHQMAGSSDVVELHGSIRRSFCFDCGKDVNVTLADELVRCGCGGLARPGVVWFGEALPAEAFVRAERDARECDLYFSIGTSGAVYPAASLPLLAQEAGAYVVEVNPNRTEISKAMDEVLFGKSGEVLPKLVEQLG